MFSEGIEELRFATTKTVMEAMAELAADAKADPMVRLKAAKIVDGMSDSLIKAYILTEKIGSDDRNVNKLSKQLDKLVDDKE
jgi:hypothetical protein